MNRNSKMLQKSFLNRTVEKVLRYTYVVPRRRRSAGESSWLMADFAPLALPSSAPQAARTSRLRTTVHHEAQPLPTTTLLAKLITTKRRSLHYTESKRTKPNPRIAPPGPRPRISRVRAKSKSIYHNVWDGIYHLILMNESACAGHTPTSGEDSVHMVDGIS